MAKVTNLAGQRLKECREQAGLSQKKLAKRVSDTRIGSVERNCNEKYISALENGKKNIGADYAKLLGEVLGVDPAYLLCESDYRNETARLIHGASQIMQAEHQCREAFELYLQALGYTCEADKSTSTVTIKEGNSERAISESKFDSVAWEIFEYAQFKIEKLVRGF